MNDKSIMDILIDKLIGLFEAKLVNDAPSFPWYKGQELVTRPQLSEWLTGSPRGSINSILEDDTFPHPVLIGSEKRWKVKAVNKWLLKN